MEKKKKGKREVSHDPSYGRDRELTIHKNYRKGTGSITRLDDERPCPTRGARWLKEEKVQQPVSKFKCPRDSAAEKRTGKKGKGRGIKRFGSKNEI